MSPCNYAAICDENRRRYGTDIGRIGPMLLADRYDDRTHFIFELLQNAEDALGRRTETSGHCGVTFTLSPGRLTLSHFGRPFDEADVRGICGIAESTKDEHSIGRFGIGFKSVYTFTDRPEVHSGDEDFAIEDYVLPMAVAVLPRQPGETQIILPLKSEDISAEREIAAGFRHFGPGALLFLRHIDAINWSIEDRASGVYLRSAPEPLGPSVERITLIGEETGKPDVDQNWLVFHRVVSSTAGVNVGRVEIAFSLTAVKQGRSRWAVEPLAASPLVVFFPTVVSTNLGFLVQGPYRTTPSRDNVPRNDPLNQQLVQETADLVVEAACWLRDNAMLDASALRCLPIDRTKFPDGAMFAPLFETVRQAFSKEALLPRFDGGHLTAAQARLARTQELRELLNAEQIEVLFGAKGCAWLTGDITQDRAPELRRYVLQELQVPEITPDKAVARLDKAFLESQSDEWVTRLYEFLNGQRAIAGLLNVLPLARLDDGTHVVAREGARSNAFLPSDIDTSFPTIRRTVCGTPEARSFLVSLGLTAPDPVDDVVWNVLPRYRSREIDGNDKAYAADIERIRIAFNTDSKIQRDKLLGALRETPFVMVIDAGHAKHRISRPGEVYIATDRLRALFAGVPGVLIVDDNHECLRGEAVRELLEACGALRYPRPVPTPKALTWEERLELRRKTGHEQLGQHEDVSDWELLGFDALLELLPTLSHENRAERARLLWEALGDLEERRGRGVFDGSYTWTHYGQRKAPPFPAAFLRRLNKTAWVPDPSGDIVRPSLVTFELLGWKANPFLLTKIVFKPPIIDQLAKEAGIEPAALDLLRKLGITSIADLERVGIARKAVGSSKGDGPESTSDHAESRGGGESVPGHGPSDVDMNGSASDESNSDASAETRHDKCERDANADESGQDTERIGATSGHEPRASRSREIGSTDKQHPEEPRDAGRRKLMERDGLDEQSVRLMRRVNSFFGGAAPEHDGDDDTGDANAINNVGWETRLVCLDEAAGGLHLEVGPLKGLPPFVKKLRAVGAASWDAFVLAANARARPALVPVCPQSGPWSWEAVGFEQEHDLGLEQLLLAAIDPSFPVVFRIDADDVGRRVAGTTLALGQAYRLLLSPTFADGLGNEFANGWRIWFLDLATQPPTSTRKTLTSLGLVVGEPWPRLEWALTAPSAWRTNARGESYPAFETGAELVVNASGVFIEEDDDVVLFLHGPSGTTRLPLSSSGLVSLGTPAPGRWACALIHSRTTVPVATLVFEISRSCVENVDGTWTVSASRGLGSLEITAPPGWPISVRWDVLGSETLATVYGNDDRTVTVEGVVPLLEARAARSAVADFVFDFRELGRRLIPHEGRASLRQVREQLATLWQKRKGIVQARTGAWLALIPAWFEPAATRLGFGLVTDALLADAEAPHGLAAWPLTIDERTVSGISRSPSRVLVLTTDLTAVMRDHRDWLDGACAGARVRDAIVTDGTRWTTHRKGDRQIKRREWNLDGSTGSSDMDDMIDGLAEGL